MEDVQWANTTPKASWPLPKAGWYIYQHQAAWTRLGRKERQGGPEPELQGTLHHPL